MNRRMVVTVAVWGSLVVGVGWALLGASNGSGATPSASSAPASAPSSAASPPTAATSGNFADTWDPAKMPTPCRTITSAEISKINGRPATAGVRLDSWPPLCEFRLGNPAETFLYVSDNPRSAGQLEYDQGEHSSETTRPIAGVGREAYWLVDSTSLHAMVGVSHVQVIYAGPGIPADAEARAIAIAKIVVTRLGPPPHAP